MTETETGVEIALPDGFEGFDMKNIHDLSEIDLDNSDLWLFKLPKHV
jgi:hypothetical protein